MPATKRGTGAAVEAGDKWKISTGYGFEPHVTAANFITVLKSAGGGCSKTVVVLRS
jgi:hypothetical protein